MNRSIARRVALASLALSGPFLGSAQVIYSQNFDSGTPGESLTDPQFGFTVQNNGVGGDLKLGPALHGWTGNSVIGAGADNGQFNGLYKALPLPTHGIAEFSADLYSGVISSDDVGMTLFSGTPGNSDYHNFELNTYSDFWNTDNFPYNANSFHFPAGMHSEPVHGSIFWNQDTGEHWAELSDGTETLDSPHFLAPGQSPMTSIEVWIDRRAFNANPGDFDNLEVRVIPSATPEPVTVSIGLAGVGLFVRRRFKSGGANG